LIEQIINALIKLKNEAQQLANNKGYSATFREANQDEADLLKGSIEELVQHFNLKVCDCNEVFAASREGQDICEGCEEHRANRMASDRADFDWHRGF
jgi:hypothetical protein